MLVKRFRVLKGVKMTEAVKTYTIIDITLEVKTTPTMIELAIISQNNDYAVWELHACLVAVTNGMVAQLVDVEGVEFEALSDTSCRFTIADTDKVTEQLQYIHTVMQVAEEVSKDKGVVTVFPTG
jgi:hypothetical protein